MADGNIRALCDFIDASPTAFHAVVSSIAMLKASGAKALNERDSWKLERGGLYYVVRDDASIVAFRLGRNAVAESGFLLAGAHTDSPGLRVRIEKNVVARGMERVAVETYGGPINSTWLDRPLSLAGRVVLRGKDGAHSCRLVNLAKPVAVIPNLAIHFNREMNKGVEYPMHTAMMPLVSSYGAVEVPTGSWILRTLAAELSVEQADIVSGELTFVDAAPSLVFGDGEEIIHAPRLDNLEGCQAVLSALCQAKAAVHTQVAALFDNEEIGSTSPRGANSSFLRDVLTRISLSYGGEEEDSFRAFARSLCISVDGAQGWHPSYADKFDEDFAPVLNKGLAIKGNANVRYATEARGEAAILSLCAQENIMCQRFRMRADLAPGSTIGPVNSALLGVRTIDVGVPMLAMHSARETAGVRDHDAMIAMLLAAYSSGPVLAD
jgi:aspartyl aminopeptidase